jgi:hypothetical protein
MGVEVTLLPVDIEYHNERGEATLASTITLPVYASRDLVDAFIHATKEHGKQVKERFFCHLGASEMDENCYGQIDHNPYGQPLTSLTASQVIQVFIDAGRSGDTKRGKFASAVGRYISALDGDDTIVVFFH